MYRPLQTIESAQEHLIVPGAALSLDFSRMQQHGAATLVPFREDVIEMIVGNYVHTAQYLRRVDRTY